MEKMKQFCFIYVKDKGMVIGSVLDTKHKVKYFNEHSKNFETTISKKLQFEWKEEIQNDEKTILNYLEMFKSININQIEGMEFHESVKYSLEKLTEIIMKQNNIKNQVLTYFLLEKSPYFKKKDDFYFYLSKEQVKKKLYLESVKKWVSSNEQILKTEEEDLLRIQLLDILENNSESKFWNELCNILEFKKNPSAYENKFMEFLKRLGVNISWTDFYVKRTQLNHNYPKVSISLDSLEKDLKKRDFYPDNTYTIDSEYTKDFDDAFTIIEYDEISITIIVHIIDLSFFIKPNDELFNSSKERISSAYFLHEKYHMFEKSLSQDFFSLRSGQIRPTIGYKFILKKDKIEFKGISQCSIIVKENLSYKQVDKIINDSFWSILYDICLSIQNQRLNQELVKKEFTTELSIDISDTNNIKIEKSQRSILKSNCIIKELSILVNEYSAKFFSNNCPILYKVQSKWTTSPKKNDLIGTDLYVQCTSPIRRFIDLITQIQLSNYLQDKSITFTKEKLEEYGTLIQDKTNFINLTQKSIQDHFIYVYFSQNINKEFEAIILRKSEKETIILLKEFDYEFSVYGLELKDVNSFLKLKIQKVDLFKHQLFVVESI